MEGRTDNVQVVPIHLQCQGKIIHQLIDNSLLVKQVLVLVKDVAEKRSTSTSAQGLLAASAVDEPFGENDARDKSIVGQLED